MLQRMKMDYSIQRGMVRFESLRSADPARDWEVDSEFGNLSAAILRSQNWAMDAGSWTQGWRLGALDISTRFFLFFFGLFWK